MPPNSHAVLSASSSNRWLHCNPSARLELEFEDRETSAASEGTAAHALCEHKLKRRLKLRSDRPVSHWDNDEMEQYTDEYVDFVMEQVIRERRRDENTQVLIEQRLDFSCFVPDGFGTGDCLIVSKGRFHIIDFKYGQGVLVEAEDNPQMKLYALGALEQFGEQYQIKKVVANYFGTGNTVRHDGGSYDAWSCLDNQNRRWTITRDVSIRADRDEEKAELATPILKYEDIEDLQKIARQLRHAGAVSNPNHGCGVHIHIGANGHTAKTLRNLVNIMASHEPLLKESLKLDSYRVSHYCQMVDSKFLKEVNRKKPTSMSALADIWYNTQSDGYRSRSSHYNGSRYHMTKPVWIGIIAVCILAAVFAPKIKKKLFDSPKKILSKDLCFEASRDQNIKNTHKKDNKSKTSKNRKHKKIDKGSTEITQDNK